MPKDRVSFVITLEPVSELQFGLRSMPSTPSSLWSNPICCCVSIGAHLPRPERAQIRAIARTSVWAVPRHLAADMLTLEWGCPPPVLVHWVHSGRLYRRG
jgi:hypothetical protein